MDQVELRVAYLWTVAVLLLIWGVGVSWCRRRGGFDLFAPEVAFGGAYLLTSFAAPVYYLWDSGAPEGLLFAANLPGYLWLASTGFLGLMSGCVFGRIPFGTRRSMRDGTESPSERRPKSARLYSVASCAVAMGSGLLVIGLIPSWGVRYGEVQFEYDISYYVVVGAQLLLLPSLAQGVRGAIASRRWLFLTVALFPGFLALFGTTGRGQMLVLGAAVLGVAHYYGRQIRVLHGVLLGSAAVVLIGVLGPIREIGVIGLVPVTGAIWSGEAFQATAIGLTMAASLGAPAFITTHVMRWFPEPMGWRFGLTYVNGILSMIPAFVYGGPQERPFESMVFVFKNLLDGPVLTGQGYAFSGLAEAYVNFGQLGPLAVFFLLAFALRYIYFRALMSERTGSSRVWYVLCLLTVITYLRADSIVFVKLLVYSTLVVWIIEILTLFVPITSRVPTG